MSQTLSEPIMTSATHLAHPRSGAHVRMSGVSKVFGSRVALEGIDFDAEPGEFVSVIGHSGCGKSTLLRLIAGLEVPTTGAVQVNHKAVIGLSRQSRMMFQEPRLLPWRNVLANVALGIVGAGGVQDSQHAIEVLRQVGLQDRQRDMPMVLSGGQKQRVALARALASKPKLLLLDEPLGALDALTRIEMQQLIERVWNDQQFTAILVTHDVEEAVLLADRVYLMGQGRVEEVLSVDLPRPRRRDHAQVGALAQRLLDRLLRPSPDRPV